MTTPKFKIEQIAICPADPEKAIKLLTEMGAGEWARDIVVATGDVHPTSDFSNPKTNVANLAFDYELGAVGKPVEFEVLHYAAGQNWMAAHDPSVSHLGMHCTTVELSEWKRFFSARGIKIAQEVKTQSHSNPVIAGKRWYHYCIFDTREILGVDIKFIVRRDQQ